MDALEIPAKEHQSIENWLLNGNDGNQSIIKLYSEGLNKITFKIISSLKKVIFRQTKMGKIHILAVKVR